MSLCGNCVFTLGPKRSIRAQATPLACFLLVVLALIVSPVFAWGSQTADINLNAANPEFNIPFSVNSMLPGDSNTLEAAVDVEHADSVNVVFTTQVEFETQSLADVLQLSIVDKVTGGELYAGPLSELATGKTLEVQLAPQADGVSELAWVLTVSAPSSMGNEYQDAACTVLFDWAVAYEDTEPVPGPDEPGTTPGAGGGILDNLPATGDMLLMLALVLFCIGAAVCTRAAAGDREFAFGGGVLPAA